MLTLLIESTPALRRFLGEALPRVSADWRKTQIDAASNRASIRETLRILHAEFIQIAGKRYGFLQFTKILV